MAHTATSPAPDFPSANGQIGGVPLAVPPRAISRVGAGTGRALSATGGDPKPLEPNTTITGGYRLVRIVGRGNFSRVWEATDARGERVAVKLLHSTHPQSIKRFQREIKVIRSLPPNQNVVQYIDHGVLPDGSLFLVLEFVVGFTLGQLLEAGRRFSEQAACSLMMQLCQAFAGLHALGVTHGDIKPNNLMLAKSKSGPTTSGPTTMDKDVIHLGQIERSQLRIKLLDFGLVRDAQGLLRLLEQQEVLPGKDFTEELDFGMLSGTPEYIAPEQLLDARREPHEPALTDTPSDVFALGVVFYQLIAGAVPWPFNSESQDPEAFPYAVSDYLEKRASGERPECPNGTSRPLWSIIARALDPDPKNRQGDAVSLYADIERFVDFGIGVPSDLDTGATMLAAFDSPFVDVAQRKPSAATMKALRTTAVFPVVKTSSVTLGRSTLMAVEPRRKNRTTLVSIIVAATVVVGVAASLLV